jgi:hypothetical protein
MVQNYHTEFLTATIFNWNHLLKEDIYKQVVVDSFQWLVKEKKVYPRGCWRPRQQPIKQMISMEEKFAVNIL